MKCSPFLRRSMMRMRAKHFLRRHLKRNHHFMSHGMEHDHHERRKMEHGHFRHHGMKHGHGGHHKMGHHHMRMHHGRHHDRHPRMCQFKRRRQLEFMRESSDDTSASPEINKDGQTPTTYAPKSNSQVTKENSKFQIYLDTSHYQPSEVSVKVVGNKIDVSAVHESTGEDWFEFHEMYRSFDVPEDVNPDTISSRLDPGGKLYIEATINTEENDIDNVREIPVIRVNE